MSRGMFDRWFYITVLSVTLVVIVPLVVVWLVLQVGPELRFAATIVIIVLWGVVSGYKDWIISKRREQQNEPRQV